MGAAVGIVAGFMGGGGMLGGLMGGGGILGQLLNGLLGGGGDGADGAAGINKALQGFAPANVINAVANLFNSISGNGIKEATNTLHKEHGLPKFIQDAVNKAVDEAMKKNQKPTEGDLQQKLNDATKDGADKEIADLARKMVEAVLKQLREESKEAGTEAAGGKKGSGKRGAMSWLQAIAKAMGDTLGAKAAKMTELSQKVSDAADAQKAAGDDKEAQQAAAADMTAAQTELNGVTQEFKLMTEAFNSALKAFGENLGKLAGRN